MSADIYVCRYVFISVICLCKMEIILTAGFQKVLHNIIFQPATEPKAKQVPTKRVFC